MTANVRTDDTLMVVYRKYWCTNIAGRFGESDGTSGASSGEHNQCYATASLVILIRCPYRKGIRTGLFG
jgi:hypothetical protein